MLMILDLIEKAVQAAQQNSNSCKREILRSSTIWGKENEGSNFFGGVCVRGGGGADCRSLPESTEGSLTEALGWIWVLTQGLSLLLLVPFSLGSLSSAITGRGEMEGGEEMFDSVPPLITCA